MNDPIKDPCILVTMPEWFAIWLAFPPSISTPATDQIQIFERRCAHEPWDWSGLRPIVDALGKQTNRAIHHCAADDAPEMCHIRLLSAGLHSAYTAPEQCCRRVTSLKSWVGENTLNLFPTSRDMFNGQLLLEKTEISYFAKYHIWHCSHSHWCNLYILI